MTAFNSTSNYGENAFIKNKPQMLQNIYNTTDVFPYWIADMDFQVAEPITQELNRLVERGVYSYEFSEQEVFEALSQWYSKRHGVSLSADKFVQVPGVLSGIALLLRQFTNEDDGVLIHTPAYHQFSNLVNKANRQVVQSPLCSDKQGYQIDFAGMEQQIIEQKVKAMIFCNPHNPTGRVWTSQDIEQVIEIAKRHDVLIISDEVHSDIIFEGHAFTSLTNFDYDKVITLIGSPAKTFGMHSISNGYVYTNNDELFEAFKTNVVAMYLDHGNAFSTFATVAAFEKGEEWLDGMLVYLQDTVKWITEFTEQRIPQLKVFQPQGTYQMWFDFSGLGFSGEELKNVVFEQAKMGLTPGDWFGAESPNFMRMNIATSRDNIEQSFNVLADAIDGFERGSHTRSICCDSGASKSCC
ncbi:MalY/PatB family protein [Vibrio cyclitrophicus]|uniref:MalY/PatB family protein n=1 Tax=Vibrio TaxID=662 RepID=UPI000C81FDBA|nr:MULTISPECIES: PatB family C-S lyase [Vibrio]MBE8558401.1 putative C-S lyase [Vibrio sp. OPT24]MDH5879753.1 PatB family C-S lyase [Vibrio sp. S/42/10]PME89285.1 aspartate aminotransferase [Vibrio cyclitrophicus]PMG43914.1 aspartate aminotransferase [Vibrio cyclitrophicus]PMH59053.1 aspartate aminotransferase [Vibrio cyclitrophicus]